MNIENTAVYLFMEYGEDGKKVAEVMYDQAVRSKEKNSVINAWRRVAKLLGANLA